MGCYNGTCNISNLPIFAGEKVVVIPLLKTVYTTESHCCNATDVFTPFGFPIIGEYNDYGGIENAMTDKNNKDFLYSFAYFYEKQDTGDDFGHVEIDKPDNFDDFVNEIFCCDNHYVQSNDFSLHPNGLRQISYMMIHYNLYERLITEMSNRIPWDKKDTCATLYKLQYLSILKEHWTISEQSDEISQNPVMDENVKPLIKMIIESSLSHISNKIFCHNSYLDIDTWKFFAEILLSKKDDWEVVLDKAVEKLVFTITLNYMRKGYLCDSGAGSQCDETRLHVILADFIKEHVSSYARRYNADCIDEDDEYKMDESGTVAPLYF